MLVAVILYFLSIPALKWFCENIPMSEKEQEAAWGTLYKEITAARTKKVEGAKTPAQREKAQKDLDALGDFAAFKAQAARGFNGSKSAAFKWFTACHNLVLIVFSAAVMVKSTPLVLGWGSEHGWKAAYCDADKSMWNSGGFGFWASVFYLSKYYEFVDTWILVCKVDGRTGKRVVPSLLQTYHHAGIALTMYGSTVSQVSGLLGDKGG